MCFVERSPNKVVFYNTSVYSIVTEIIKMWLKGKKINHLYLYAVVCSLCRPCFALVTNATYGQVKFESPNSESASGPSNFKSSVNYYILGHAALFVRRI